MIFNYVNWIGLPSCIALSLFDRDAGYTAFLSMLVFNTYFAVRK